MLLKFKLKNWASMRGAQELSLYRASPKKRAGVREDSTWDPEVSSLAAVYGPNASGKSTLIDGMRFFQFMVRQSYRSLDDGDRIPRMPFFLDANSYQDPTSFEIEFRTPAGVEYQYGFSVDNFSVLSEYLYVFKTRKRTVLFERGVDDAQPWYFGPSFKGPSSRIRETTRSNSLFLAAAAAAGNSIITDAQRWIATEISIYSAVSYEAEHSVVASRLLSDETYKSKLMAFLKHSDLGVSAISVLSHDDPDELASTDERGDIFDPEAEDARASAPNSLTSQKREFTLSLSRGIGSGTVDLPFAWESDGTKALISFASIALRALESGNVCVVDEIDTSLHPVLVAELVSIFANPFTNPKQSQLIFTTHDVSLLKRWDTASHRLEKDQVWLVEKDPAGASALFALIEYGRAREDENLARGYLTGRFGAIPSVSIAHALLDIADAEPDQ